MDKPGPPVKITAISTIRLIFDRKAFISQQSGSLPDRSEALILVEKNDPQAVSQLNAGVRDYYQNATDSDDDPKSRPALIVSLNARNEFSNSVLAMPVTTNPRPSPTHVALPTVNTISLTPIPDR